MLGAIKEIASVLIGQGPRARQMRFRDIDEAGFPGRGTNKLNPGKRMAVIKGSDK